MMAIETAHWTPAPGEEAYYAIPSPSSQQWAIPTLFPSFNSVDPTFGRSALPFAPNELRMRADPAIDVKEGKVWFDLKKSDDFISYETWSPKCGSESSEKATLVYIHGINDYRGKFSDHAAIFLNAGYRVAVIDLPGHGRSSGLHAYVPNLDKVVDGIELVIRDIIAIDARPVPSKFFVAGGSLGGLIACLFCMKQSSSKGAPIVSGGLFLCPALSISPASRPAYAVELFARCIASFAGKAAIAGANKGKNSEDPFNEQQFERDPQTYHGKLRVATGLEILRAITKAEKEFASLSLPFALFHGTGDKVASYHGSEQLYADASTADKAINLYEGYEHILLRTGRSEEDDVRRQRVLKDMLNWLETH